VQKELCPFHAVIDGLARSARQHVSPFFLYQFKMIRDSSGDLFDEDGLAVSEHRKKREHTDLIGLDEEDRHTQTLARPIPPC
jgi:hypothetical protein